VSGGAGEFGVGDVLGEFRIVGKLGDGGMGVVYLAEDERLERKLALKVTAPHLARNPEFRRRFVAEARNAAAIDHPNVVTVYSSGTIEDNLYIAMRYVKGTDLRSRLARGELEPEVAVEIVVEVAAALDAAHAAGMVHRDVKPGNVLIEAGGPGHAFLTDFGLTKNSADAGTQLTGTGQLIGTIDYLAPEQIQGGRIDARTDVYALGCVLYEMLTGRVPFAGTEMQKMWGHVNEPFPVPEGIPRAEELAPVLARATAKDPDDRYPSAGDLGRAASAALAGSRVRTPERSVAVGPAAEGLDETIAAADPARTRTARAPAPFREQATTELARPPARPPGNGGGSARPNRAPWIAAAAAIFAAGLIAAAILVAAEDSGAPGGTTVVREGEPDSGSGEAGATEEWPDGTSAYSAMLGAFTSEAGARRREAQMEAKGMEAGVLYSSNFSSLSPGYWVVFSGTFAEPATAEARAGEAQELGIRDAYAKYVSP